MHRLITAIACLALLTASSAPAISPSDDLLIAAAARTNRWTADLYIVNPGATPVTVNVMWLGRGQANLSPLTESFEVLGGETLILDDVLLNNFGMGSATGALRITAPGGEVTANLVVFTGAGSPDGTYGSGFEAIPVSSATSNGESTTLSGVVLDDDFYTNLFATAGANGVTMDVDLLDPDGALLDTVQIDLLAWEPWLSAVSDLWDVASFGDGTARVSVTDGSMVMLGSKIDRISKDPTTLEQEFGAGGGSVDGIYEVSIWDLDYATGSTLYINNGLVDRIDGTYMNYQKLDAQEEYACPVIWRWGFDLPLPGVPVEEFETGYVFTDDYYDAADFAEGGTFTWTVTFTMDDNVGFYGSIDVVGAGFSGDYAGCNGDFEELLMYGGKEN
jgi:hypothetical protein